MSRNASLFANLRIQHKVALAYAVILLLFAGTCGLFARNIADVRSSSQRSEHSLQVLNRIGALNTAVLQQQNGLRGYVLTQQQRFLDPYLDGEANFGHLAEEVLELTGDNAFMQAGIQHVSQLMQRWRREIADPFILQLQQPGGFEQVRGDIVGGRGLEQIGDLLDQLETLREHELTLFGQRSRQLDDSLHQAQRVVAAMLLLGILFGLVVIYATARGVARPLGLLTGVMARVAGGETEAEVPFLERGDEIGALARGLLVFRDSVRQLAQRERLKTQLSSLTDALQGRETAAEFADALAGTLCAAVGAVRGAVFVWNDESSRFELAGGHGLPPASSMVTRFADGEGLLGQAARDGEPLALRQIPDSYVPVATGLGSAAPRSLRIYPLPGREHTLGVVELALLAEPDAASLDYLLQATTFAALSLETLLRGVATVELLRRTQEQAEELRTSDEALRTQEEELRATNEALRDKSEALQAQSATLQASQEEMQVHAEELRVTNAALEEKSEELRAQKAALEAVQVELEEKAVDLEQASRYKSEFLANMSHELRTPLNSMLILSKSLADNEERTLNAEQVESARIIHDSGRSLLALINDILDLSKVEAGKLDVVAEEVRVESFAAQVERQFRPVAQERKLKFTVTVEPGGPAHVRTDGVRLVQIAANLLSNSFKFTESGEVRMHVGRPPAGAQFITPGLRADNALMLRVSDTGVGISDEQLSRLFQAFEQAESGTSRRYGGTGLGLSICRGLAELLGGEIHVDSRSGAGSTFTVYVAERLEPGGRVRAPVPVVPPPAPAAPVPAPTAVAEALPPVKAAEGATILIIEDDAQFAEVLAGIARAKNYRALTALDGESGLALARRHRPTGILLDISLPKMDGWEVLRQLKADPATAGIPVHFISGAEEAPRALAAGASSFLKKPVGKPQVSALLDGLPRPAAGDRRRILVIDDYEPDRRLVREMLRREPIDIDEAPTAEKALEKMTGQQYDLLVLDLGLPGMDGFQFLEHASKRGELPAVVIHSGRELTRDESLKLREFTDSIVMKDAPSPQRLLDEVTLFLHSIRRVAVDEPPAPRPPDSALSGRTVLVVDDDMRNIFALSKVMRSHGLKVIMAQDGKKALAQLDANPDVDLALIDIMMPGMDGYETMRQVRARERWQKLPIIAVTAKAMGGDREKCIAAGANDYCPKPIDVDELMEQVRRLLAR